MKITMRIILLLAILFAGLIGTWFLSGAGPIEHGDNGGGGGGLVAHGDNGGSGNG